MKKKIMTALLISVVLLAGCQQEKEVLSEAPATVTAVPTPSKEPEIKITFEEFSGASEETDTEHAYTYHYNVPSITIPGKKDVEEHIQKLLDKEVEEFVSFVTSGDFGVVDEWTKDVISQPFYQNLDWSVIRMDDKIISLSMVTEGYEGGAHGWVVVDYFNFYTETGEQVTFESLGVDFRQKSEELVLLRTQEMQAESEEEIFYENYETMIPTVVLDGTESANEVYSRIYDNWYETDYMMSPNFAVTETGFMFTSGQYMLQPYVYGILDFHVNAQEYGENGFSEIFKMDKVQEEYRLVKERSERLKGFLPIAAEEVEQFLVKEETEKESREKLGMFEDFSEILSSSLVGTWYSPEQNTMLRITEKYCYIYYPALELDGKQRYAWELIDRSEQGLCPMLVLYAWGSEMPGMAYYIGGVEEAYFWCNSQQEIFYKQTEEK